MLKGLSMSQSDQEGRKLLKSLKIDSKRNERVANLSGGMKRKLCLAIALMGDPQVLMLDEPTSGLDPESRRLVWDMLLSSRGQRTTIITTHFMEEADVLGDRIAIMDHGQVSCYGTSMFLKKVYGIGYHLDISKVEQAPVAPITRVVEQHVDSAVMKLSSPTQLMYNIKYDESSKFPALFSALDDCKMDIGLTGLGITCTTMEDVFLKVAAKPEQVVENTNGHIGKTAFVGKPSKVFGFGLIYLQIKALSYKWSLTRMKSWVSTIISIVVPVVLMAATMLRLMDQNYKSVQPKLLISLVSFPGVHVAMSSDNETVSNVIKHMVTEGNGIYETIPDGTNLNEYMAAKIRYNLIQYERQMIAGFEIKYNYLVGGYSQYFAHSLPVVLNMIANTFLHMNSPFSNITVYNHPVAIKVTEDKCDRSMSAYIHVFNFPLNVVFVSLGLMILAMSFISFPLKERVSSAKQLQLMTGLSPLLYWTITFLCDFAVYLLVTLLMIVMVIVFQSNGILTASGYTGTLVLVFLLFGTSGITFAYFFSFLVKSSVKASVLFVITNLVTGTFGATFLAILDSSYTGYGLWRFILSFNPVFSVTSALIHLITVMYINGACLQCGENCVVQNPLTYLDGGPSAKHPHGINSFLIFLTVDTLIYSGIVLVIEYGIVKKIAFYVSSFWIEIDNEIFVDDSDIEHERDQVFSSEKLKVVAGYTNHSSLRVKDLGKKYNSKMTAVYGVTFQVNKGECFGLLGVNGAGKSTTFKMLTGEEVPNKGDASIQQISLLKQKSRFLEKIGYCPQFDAINKLLTGKQMLRVYAQLRGIPSAHCDSEVSRWVQIMGLMEFGDRPCGTYSGGNKRKLSTAMAFIGEPPVVFLDEPTSGVDPVSRRKLWDVVARCQEAGQAIVLTSHSMEECEALCSRLTIMVAGQMKCIGTTRHLKQKFGQGYTIKIKLLSQDHQNDLSLLKLNMTDSFQDSCIKDEHLGLLHYHIPDPSIRLSEVFTKMECLKNKHDVIEDYDVSDTTLEQVFMSFARAVTNEET